MLQKDADFLRNHMTDEDSNGEVIARLESRGCSDSCDSCDLEIFNGHFFCTACGRTECPRCGLSKSKCSRTGTKGRHRKEVAVVHSDIQGNCAAAFDISGRTVAFVLNEKKIVYCFVCNT